MTDTTPAPTGDTAVADGVDASGDATNTGASTPTAEELFEVAYGKDEKGNPLTKKFTKADLLKHAGMGLSAHERFEQVRRERANLETIAKAMKDPSRFWEIAKGLGHDVDALLRGKVEEVLADAALTPEQKEAKINKIELETLRKEKAERQRVEQEAETARLEKHYTEQLTSKVTEALTAAKLPNTQANRAAIAGILQTLWQSKDESGAQRYPDPFKIPNDAVVSYLKKNRVGGLKELVEGADDDALLELLDPDLVEKITKAVSKKLQKAQGGVDNTVVNTPSKDEGKSEKRRVLTTAEQEAEVKERIRKAQIAWERRQGKR